MQSVITARTFPNVYQSVMNATPTIKVIRGSPQAVLLMVTKQVFKITMLSPHLKD